jgi:hypothetical protein
MKVLETKKKKRKSEAGALIFSAIRKANEEDAARAGEKNTETEKK